MNNSTRFAVLIMLLAVITGPQADAADKIESAPAGDRLVLDGDPSDWEGFPITYLEDSLPVFAVAHDDSNLYLMYRFADQGLARHLLMRGVTMWINGDGKTKNKNEEFAVRYPGSAQIAEQFEDEEPRPGRYRAETGGSETAGRGGPPPSLASMRQVPGQLTVIRMGMKENEGSMGNLGGRGGGGMGGGPPSGMGGGGIGGMGGGMGGIGGRGADPGRRMDPETGWLSVTLPPRS